VGSPSRLSGAEDSRVVGGAPGDQPLIDGQGNLGTAAGTNRRPCGSTGPVAMSYTEARLNPRPWSCCATSTGVAGGWPEGSWEGPFGLAGAAGGGAVGEVGGEVGGGEAGGVGGHGDQAGGG
jgi:hypothetical protein